MKVIVKTIRVIIHYIKLELTVKMKKNNVKATTLKKFKNDRKAVMDKEVEDLIGEKVTQEEKELHFVDHDINEDLVRHC